ncbi:glycoside hydrolase domain-containing protein [Micromonospora sp. NPDC049366]|uniref:glycoside hydrolase domain-containing protein n=1 Tax=Micromonospora sp. NPDC049366 TaxID=3364271 RepID=UPI00379E4F8C
MRAADRERNPWRTAAATVVTVVVAAASAGVVVTPAVAKPAEAKPVDYTSFVNPFVSTAGDDGNDLPGAQAPNGIVKVNPLTTPGRNHTGYDYNQTRIAGFTQTNLDGVGGSGGGGDILVVPTQVEYSARPSTGSYSHPFSHDDETATPGYYQVRLGEISGRDGAVRNGPGTINAEVTATTRTALHRYAFPDGATPELVVDLNNNFTSRTGSSVDVERLDDGRVALSGDINGNFNGASYALHYHAETEQPVASFKTWGSGEFGDAASRRGTDTGAVLTFAPDHAGEIGLRITVSPISADQARIDQGVEVGKLSFDDVRAGTKAVWNDRLGRVDVSASVKADSDGTLRRLFYTHLYRMFALPMNATSTSGTYRGVDGVVHKVDDFTYYDAWSSWDDFRKYSVFAYVDPEMYRDMIQSLIYLFADVQSTGKGIGGLTHSVPTVRWERSAVIVADALSKGFTGFDRLDQAYPALKSYVGYYNGNQLRQGYIENRPGDTVQRGYDQWALAIIADTLGRVDDAKQLRAQAALPIANLYKPGAWTAADGTKAALLTPRDAAGNWGEVDYERFEAANLYQGTLWQYNWYPAYDMDGVVAAMGGPEAARRAVTHFMGEDDPDNGLGMLHSNANEIDLQAPYLFNYVGLPSLTQKWVRTIYTKESWNRYIATGGTDEYPSGNGELRPPLKTKVYKLDPRGFLPTMDNDAGTMSTMFVAAAIGLFPVTAGSSQYQIGSPFFDRTTISYADGRTFTVSADGVSDDSYYIQSASLNGAAFGNTWLDYRTLVNGGSLDVRMGAKPSIWGTNGKPAYSMSTAGDDHGGGTPNGYTVHASPMTIAARADGRVDGAIALSLGGGAKFRGPRGKSLVASGAATIHGLPAGVSGDVVGVDATTARVVLSGTAAAGARFYVTFADSAFIGRISADQVTGDGLSSRTALSISVAAAERAKLRKLVDEGLLVRQGNYSFASYHAFRGVLERAQTVLADDASSTATLRNATESLTGAIAALTLDQGGYRVLEAEQSDEWSGGDLKNEANSSNGNLGGVRDGAWIRYKNLDFAGVAPKTLTIRYASTYSPTGTPSAIEVHAGTQDGPIVGKAALPGTGNWGTYVTVQAEITDPGALTRARDVTLVFHAPAGQAWVSNFDWFQFRSTAPGEEPGATLEPLTATNTAQTGNGRLPLNLSRGLFENVTDGAWARWGSVDLGVNGVERVTVSYDKPRSRAASDSHIELHLGAAGDERMVDIPLPYSGDGWGTEGKATVGLPASVFAGVQDVVAVFRSATHTDAQPYVANVTSLTFTAAAPAPSSMVVEAEKWVGNSGSGLKSEQSTWDDGTQVTNLGATYNGAWLDYDTIDFGSKALQQVSVHYVNNSSRCGRNSAIDVYLDHFDPGSPGDPYVTVPLPVTGSTWQNAATTTVALPAGLTGSHRVFLRLRTTPDGNHPYVANIDNLTFATAPVSEEPPGGDRPVDKSGLTAAISEAAAYVGDKDRYGSIDFGVFERELDKARAVAGSETATQSEVDAQARALRLAFGQLVPRARLSLENTVARAESVEQRRYTDASWAALTSALTAARATLADAAASDAALSNADATLAKALSGLTVKPNEVPAVPAAVSTQSDASSVTVRWSAPEDDGGSPVTGFVVALEDGHELAIDDAGQKSAVFTWLKQGTAARARVRAVNTVGASAWSPLTEPVIVGASAPPAPEVAAVRALGKDVRVSWTPSGDGGSRILAYRVTLDQKRTQIVAGSARAVVFPGAGGGSHTARVDAINAVGTSAMAASVASAAQMSGGASTAVATGPFPSEVLSARYDSDSWPTTPDGSPYFVHLLRGFTQLGTDVRGANEKIAALDTVSAYNDTKALEINRAAASDQVKRAENDADHGADTTMADGLGSRLGDLYLQARSEGKLPKTNALFGRITSGLDGTGTAKNTYAYKRPFVRMGLVGEGGLVRDSSNGSYGGLAGDGSFPSGHAYGGYTAGTFLATLLPELAPQILARTSEYGDNRIVLGFHYPLDVMGSRMTGQATVAHRWADPAFEDLLMQTHDEIESVLLDECREEGFDSLLTCAGEPYRGLDADHAASLYTERLSYGFPHVAQSGVPANIPDEAGALLTTAFPHLTNAQRVQILEQTALDSGYPLDLTAAGDPSWQRINLARAMTARVEVNDDGTVTVTNYPDDTKASVATAASLTVDGVAVDGFDARTQTYMVDWPKNRRLPAVVARPTEHGAKVSASTAKDGTRVLTVTSANGQLSRSYTVAFYRTADDHRPSAVQPGHPGQPGHPNHPAQAGTPGRPGPWTTISYTGTDPAPLWWQVALLSAVFGLAAGMTGRLRRRAASRR